jgi:pimeloyl-ACP methyl ester carboxylesterase
MLFHQQLGSAGPVVIGLHGLATANRLLSLRLIPLAQNARLLFPDLLGHGQSPWPDCAYGIRDHLDAFQEWRRAAGVAETPVYLTGVSMGAVLALHYAARESEWYGSSTVRGVAAISTPAYPDLATGRAWLARAMPMAYLMIHHPRAAAGLCRFLCGIAGRGWTYGPRLAPWLPSDLVQDTFAHCWQSLSRTLEQVVLNPRLAGPLAALPATPLLFIHGDRDRLAPLDFLRASLSERPTARLLVLSRAGHDAIVTHTPVILDVLREFIRPETTTSTALPSGSDSRSVRY